MIAVSWTRPGSGFTLLFEFLVMAMTESMPVAEVYRMVTKYVTKLWRIILHHVVLVRARNSHAAVERVGIDEAARACGHAYMRVFVELDTC